jgi:hypothetical protein
MPTAVPPYIDSHTDDQNPFAGEFTPKEIWTRLHRCNNTAPRLDGISYAQWKKFEGGGYALNTVFNSIHRLDYIPQG